jgi:hypothetical protein
MSITATRLLILLLHLSGTCLFSAVPHGAGQAFFAANKPRSALELSTVKGMLRKNATSSTTVDQSLVIIKQDNGVLILHNRGRDETVQIAKVQSRISIESIHTRPLVHETNAQLHVRADAIFGIFELPLGSFLGVVTKSSSYPALGAGVREVREIDLIQIGPTSALKSDAKLDSLRKNQPKALSMLTELFSTHSFYFSISPIYDITRNTQSNSLKAQKLLQNLNEMYLSADERFFWNLNISFAFIKSGLGNWVTPMCNIWTSTKSFSFGSRAADLTLISRRGCRRQGPRYIKRGIDEKGDVANFVETEQILRVHNKSTTGGTETFSFVQIRGSIPLFWEQNESWKLRPHIVPESNISVNIIPLLSHVLALHSEYVDPYKKVEKLKLEQKNADIVFVNLIDKIGTQGELGRSFLTSMAKITGERDKLAKNLSRTEISQEDYSMNILMSYPLQIILFEFQISSQ